MIPIIDLKPDGDHGKPNFVPEKHKEAQKIWRQWKQCQKVMKHHPPIIFGSVLVQGSSCRSRSFFNDVQIRNLIMLDYIHFKSFA